MKLFCIPYAGGMAGYYMKLVRYLDPTIALRPLELAGRGTRRDEAFYSSFREAVDDLYGMIVNEIGGGEPYFLFGHSMGGLLAYELYRKLEISRFRLPGHIFFSAASPPFMKDTTAVSRMTDEDLLAEMVKWGGTASEFFGDDTLRGHFLPILKADLRIIEDYGQNDAPIHADMTVLWGTEDKDQGKMPEWRKMALRSCRLVPFEGGHFYLNGKLAEVADIVNATARSYCSPLGRESL